MLVFVEVFSTAITYWHCVLNLQALDTFNTAVVSPIYYVMFTSLTILASVIMFKVISFPWMIYYRLYFVQLDVI